MRLSEYASTQRTYGSRKVPRSVQQSIPIDQIYEDGTWRCGNVYSQMWSMPDINFTMSDEDNKAKILNLLGKVYMGVPSDCWLKICIVSQRMDEKSFRENVLLHRNLDGLDKWRVERNRRIRQCVQDAGNVVQHQVSDSIHQQTECHRCPQPSAAGAGQPSGGAFQSGLYNQTYDKQ